MEREPRTLMEAVRYFADADRTLEMAVALRWPMGVHCPTCGRTDVRFIATRKLWECKEKHSKRQFSVKVGTIFEDSALPLDKWFVAIWAIANCKNGISSYELARSIGVTQKSAWHMRHRIRLAMKVGSVEKMGGDSVVEADESYIGGRSENMHAAKRKARISRAAANDKAVVLGILERSTEHRASRVHARVIADANRKTLHGEVRSVVQPGASLATDSAKAYRGLSVDYVHQHVNHSVGEYVRDNVHTNGIENFWSLLKRGIKGTYVAVEPFHLQRYVEEQVFRFNERKDDDLGRFKKAVRSIAGRRLTYAQLTTGALA